MNDWKMEKTEEGNVAGLNLGNKAAENASSEVMASIIEDEDALDHQNTSVPENEAATSPATSSVNESAIYAEITVTCTTDIETSLDLGDAVDAPDSKKSREEELGNDDKEDSAVERLSERGMRSFSAIKKIQYDYMKLEAKFYEEVHKLECKLEAACAPLFQKREDIISGRIDPSDEDCDCPYKDDSYISMELSCEHEEHDSSINIGFPAFWLRAMKNVTQLNNMIQLYDEPILEKLTDIRVLMKQDPMGFTLEFHFMPNMYFDNSVLVKNYDMKCAIEEENPFAFHGPVIYNCSGCNIMWKNNKNVTRKRVFRKMIQKNSRHAKTISSYVRQPSFFNFFNPPVSNQEACPTEKDKSNLKVLLDDYNIGFFLRERFIPRVFLYLTGEAFEAE